MGNGLKQNRSGGQPAADVVMLEHTDLKSRGQPWGHHLTAFSQAAAAHPGLTKDEGTLFSLEAERNRCSGTDTAVN
jgi:hypothetical protein